MKETKIVQEKPIPIKCHRCSHLWNYTGKNRYVASCPYCKTTLMIQKHRLLQQQQQQENSTHHESEPGVRGSPVQGHDGVVVEAENLRRGSNNNEE